MRSLSLLLSFFFIDIYGCESETMAFYMADTKCISNKNWWFEQCPDDWSEKNCRCERYQLRAATKRATVKMMSGMLVLLLADHKHTHAHTRRRTFFVEHRAANSYRRRRKAIHAICCDSRACDCCVPAVFCHTPLLSSLALRSRCESCTTLVVTSWTERQRRMKWSVSVLCDDKSIASGMRLTFSWGLNGIHTLRRANASNEFRNAYHAFEAINLSDYSFSFGRPIPARVWTSEAWAECVATYQNQIKWMKNASTICIWNNNLTIYLSRGDLFRRISAGHLGALTLWW